MHNRCEINDGPTEKRKRKKKKKTNKKRTIINSMSFFAQGSQTRELVWIGTKNPNFPIMCMQINEQHWGPSFYPVHHESLFAIDINFKVTEKLHDPRKENYNNEMGKSKKIIQYIKSFLGICIRLTTPEETRSWGRRARTKGHILRRRRRQTLGNENSHLGFANWKWAVSNCCWSGEKNGFFNWDTETTHT